MTDQHAALRAELLRSAGHDYTPLWEAWAEAHGFWPDAPLSQRLAWGEEAIRDLLSAGLVKLYRAPWPGRDYVEVPREEVESVLQEWNSWVPDHDPQIWFTTTEQGDREVFG